MAVWTTAFCLVWAVAMWLSSGNLDGYNDMLENYAWSQAWDWGTHKHPPFFAWVVGVWFSVFPQNDLSYRLLAYANVAVALWGVIFLGRRLGLAPLSAAAALLLMWSFPYSNLASKFNANTQLLSLWPWTAGCLLASWQEQGRRGQVFAVLLGLGAAASMLSKYYSGIFLLGLLLPTLLSAPGRRWLCSPGPYLALLVFGLALLPHMRWVLAHDGVTLRYVGEQGGGETQWVSLLRFALAPLYYWLLAWLACVLAFAAAWRTQPGAPSWASALVRLMWRSWQPAGWTDSLFWLALAPWLLTLLCGVAGVAELSEPWAIPIGYAFTLLWLRNLQQQVPLATLPAIARLRKAFWPVLALTALLGLVVGVSNATHGQLQYYRPTQEVARRIASDWARNHPQTALGWAAGAWGENALLAFYALPQVRTLPSFPDEYPALLSPHPSWRREGGVLICPLGAVTPQQPQALGGSGCEQEARRWLTGHGWPVRVQRIEAMREGWAFPHPRPFAYAVFEVLPVQP